LRGEKAGKPVGRGGELKHVRPQTESAMKEEKGPSLIQEKAAKGVLASTSRGRPWGAHAGGWRRRKNTAPRRGAQNKPATQKVVKSGGARHV